MISTLQPQFLEQVKAFGSTHLAILIIMCLSFIKWDQSLDVFVYLSNSFKGK